MYIAALIAFGVLGVVLFIEYSGSSSPSLPQEPGVDGNGTAESTSNPTSAEEAEQGDLSVLAEKHEATRVAQGAEPEEGGLEVAVRTSDGRGIASAVVRLFRSSDNDAPGRLPLYSVPALPQVLVECSTDETGTALLTKERLARANAQNPKDQGFWLQATAKGFAGSKMLLTGLATRADCELVLFECPMLEVQVMDAGGEPVSGAEVIQLTFGGDDAAPMSLFDASTTNLSGRAILGALPTDMVVWARKGEQVSRPWRGSSPQSLTLTLGDSFFLEGRVSTTGMDSFEGEALQLTVTQELGSRTEVLRSISLEGLEFGPLPIPWKRESSFAVTLEGPGLVTCMRNIAPVSEGASVYLELEAQAGVRFLGRVSTEEGADIAGATATLRWREEDGTHAAAEIRADSWGYFDAICAPPGSIEVQYRAPGYYAPSVFTAVIPNTDHMLWAGLKPSARLAGHVLKASGSPAGEFKVLAWRVGETNSLQTHQEYHSTDGRFEFEDAPQGDLYVLAYSNESPGSEVARVHTGTEESASLALSLLDPIPLYGGVFDTQTDDPIDGASIQAMVSSPDGPIAEWATAVKSDRSGLFSSPGAAPLNSWIRVKAEGYAALTHVFLPSIDATSGSGYDLGQLYLRRTHALRVRVLANQGSDSPPPHSAKWEAYTFGDAGSNDNTSIGASGEVVFDGVGPGWLGVGVLRRDPIVHHWIEMTQSEAGPWTIDLVEGGGRSVEMELLNPDGSPFTERAYVLVGADRGESQEFWQFPLEHGQHAITAGVYADRINLTVLAEDYQEQLAQKTVDLREDSQAFTIVIGGRKTTVQVLLFDGSPAADASLSLTRFDKNEGQSFGRTDKQGIAQFTGLARDLYITSILPAEGGTFDGIEVDFRETDRASVELSELGTLVVQCEDAGTPLPNVEVTVFNSLQSPWFHASSGSDARASFDAVGKGRYRIQLSGEGIWNSTQVHSFVPTGAPLVQEAYRLGDLELDLVDENGAAMAGLVVELTWIEKNEPVQAWIDQGLLVGTTLETDGRGTIHLDGIPRGAYRWTASGSSGISGSGVVDVGPGVLTEALGKLK